MRPIEMCWRVKKSESVLRTQRLIENSIDFSIYGSISKRTVVPLEMPCRLQFKLEEHHSLTASVFANIIYVSRPQMTSKLMNFDVLNFEIDHFFAYLDMRE